MNIWKTSLLAAVAAPLFAGALTLQIADPAGNAEAKQNGAVLVARITACHSPGKTVVSASAEGLVDGKRQTIAVKVIPLATPGTFAVRRDWPAQGNWAVRLTASNPDYKDYQTGLIVPMNGDTFEWTAVQHLYRQPLAQDADAVLRASR